MSQKKIKKALFPVGGMGTRFLPATKSMPKEMLPVYNKPLIQYAFEEAKDAGIEQFIFIIGKNKNSINNHFTSYYETSNNVNDSIRELESNLAKNWVPASGSIAFVNQNQPLGLGHAILCAKNFIGEEPFAILLADEMLHTKGGFLKQMVELYNNSSANIIAVADVEPDKTSLYGIVKPNSDDGSVVTIGEMVEKPSPELAPSNISITGRYILNHNIFSFLEKTKAGISGEIQLTDAMKLMLQEEKFLGLRCKDSRFDCGNPLGLLEANIALAIENAPNKEIMRNMLKKFMGLLEN